MAKMKDTLEDYDYSGRKIVITADKKKETNFFKINFNTMPDREDSLRRGPLDNKKF